MVSFTVNSGVALGTRISGSVLVDDDLLPPRSRRFFRKINLFTDPNRVYIVPMPHTLNMTMPLKQDAASLAALQHVKENFATIAQPAIDAALAKSHLVHFARVVVIDDKYIQVLTEFDGPVEDYTEFFRRELQDVFKLIFSLADGVPPWDEMNNADTFFEVSAGFNVRSLGTSTEGYENEGYLFSATGDKMVTEIQTALRQPAQAAGA